jgi:hypothetical protein
MDRQFAEITGTLDDGKIGVIIKERLLAGNSDDDDSFHRQ